MAKFRAACLGQLLPQMNRVHGHFPPHMLMTLAGKGACGLGGWERTGRAGAIGYIQQDSVYN